ncbi:UNVERIFIED_CONTAM: energy-coupling factor transporter ATP-binding protein EcfA2 [Streptomyces graminofaciens]
MPESWFVAGRGKRVAILVVADTANQRGDLFNDRMKDLVHALGYEIARTNIHKPGREIDIVANHTLEARRAIIECKAKKEKIGGGDVNKFVGAMDAERCDGESLSGYFVSISGFTDSAIEQEVATGRNRVTLLGPKEVQEQLQRGRVVVSRTVACGKAGSLRTGWMLDEEADLVAHESGWLWMVYFMRAGERKGYTLVHADGSFPSHSMGRRIAAALKREISQSLTYVEGTPDLSEADISTVRDSYFRYIATEYGEFTLEGFPVDQHLGSKSIELEELYVPQFLEPVAESDDVPEEDDSTSGRQERHPLREILENHRAITVLGAPGSGKSTLIKRLATSYANSQRRVRISDGLPDADWLPLVIKCREIRSSDGATITELLEDIPRHAEFPSGAKAFSNLISRALRDGSALVLIDGLDEFSDTSGRVNLLRRLRTFMGMYPLCTVLVTSREAGYRDVAGFVSERFAQYRVSELNNEEITSLTLAWHKQAHGRSASVLDRAAILAEQIIETDRVRRLAVNPLLLTTLLLVQRWIGDLPRKRSVLYEKAIELLLMTWNVEGYDPLDLDEAKPHLAYLAHAMTRSGKQQVSQDEMLFLFQEARTALPEVLAYCKLSPRDLLQRVELRSSLVSQVGHAIYDGRLQPTYEFKHLTFQEYLTATAIAQGWHADAPADGQHLNAIQQYVLNPQWHEVIALYGVLAGRRGKLLIEFLCDRFEQLIDVLGEGEGSPNEDQNINQMMDLSYLIYQCLDDEVQAPPELADRALDLIIPHLEDVDFDGLITSRYGQQLLEKARKEVDDPEDGSSPCIGILTRLFFLSLPQVADPKEVVHQLKGMLKGDSLYDRISALGALMSLAYWQFGGFERFRNGNLDPGTSVAVCKECLPEVVSFIRDDHVVVRFTALWALAWTARSVPFEASRQAELFPDLMGLYFDDPDQGVRRFAGWALVEIVDYSNVPVPELTASQVATIEGHLINSTDIHEEKAAKFLAVVSRDEHLIRKVTEQVANSKHQGRFERDLLQFVLDLELGGE